MPAIRKFALVILAFAASSPAYGDFTFIYAGHTYDLVTTTRTWTAAAADAASRSVGGVTGELARIDDQAENDAVFAQLLAQVPSSSCSKTTAPDGGGGAYVWLGGTDRKADGTWLWDGANSGAGDQFWSGKNTGQTVGGLYSNWGKTSGHQNEPDDFGGTQDALGLSLNGWPLGVRGQWNDLNETNRLYALVEIAAVPEPVAVVVLGAAAALMVSRQGRRS
jgi:hypothetical protein